MDTIIVLHLFTGGLLLGASLLMKIWPPRKINPFYGYRTPRSMKNQFAWDDANKFSADLLMWSGISTVLVQLIGYATLGGHISVLIAVGYFLTSVILTMILTERRLIKKGY